jgi:hypothetical protein
VSSSRRGKTQEVDLLYHNLLLRGQVHSHKNKNSPEKNNNPLNRLVTS